MNMGIRGNQESNGSQRLIAKMRKLTTMAATSVVVVVVSSGATQAQIFNGLSQIGDAPTAGITPAIQLTNSNAAAVSAFLAGQAGQPQALRVIETLTNPDSLSILSGFTGHVFADFENAFSFTQTADLVVQAPGAVVGNFNLDPLSPDSTQVNSNNGPTEAAYVASGVGMSNSVLFPGAPSIKNPASGNSSAPNIRSGLFTSQLTRLSNVETTRGTTTTIFNQQFPLFPESHQNVPIVTRFNNWGNGDLNNGSAEGFDYVFDTTDASTPKYYQQLLSRGDYSALVAHYRLRGADGVTTFQSGVIGYTQLQLLADTANGWNLFNPILDTAGTKTISSGTSINVDGADLSLEEAGAAWSGAVNDDALAILLSNLSGDAVDIDLPDQIEGLPLSDTVFNIAGGSHELLIFDHFVNVDLGIDGYLLVDRRDVTGDDNRAGTGVPEPACLVMLGVGGLLIGLPRQARRKA
jgi:hypothetical protein